MAIAIQSVTTVVPLPELQARIGDELPESLLTELLAAAVRHIETYIGAPLTPKTQPPVTLLPGETVLPHAHIVSLTSVTSGDTPLTGWEVSSSGVLRRPYLTYAPAGPITVTYVAGFADLPPDIREAVIYTVKHAYDSERGSTPVPFQSGADDTFVTASGFYLPNRVKELLAPYRAVGGIA